MFWIMGGDRLVRRGVRLIDTQSPVYSSAQELSLQMTHVAWEGFRFYDLIFPLFLFLAGCSIPFSLDRFLHQQDSNRLAAYGRIFRRGVLLFLLGLIYNGLLQMDWLKLTPEKWLLDFSTIRLAGVLQRIAICTMIASLIYLNVRWRGQVLIIIALLGGYFALMMFVAAPGGKAGDLSPAGNLSGWVDRQLPGKIMKDYYGYGDNEGLLSTIPAIATAMFGALAGQIVKHYRQQPWQSVMLLIGIGLLLLATGWLWSFSFPLIKNLWTSSFTCLTAGWSFVLLGLFVMLFDCLRLTWLGWFWAVIGMNSITIYVAPRLINFDNIAQFFVGGLANYYIDDMKQVILIVAMLLAKWLFLWFLYEKKVFLRL